MKHILTFIILTFLMSIGKAQQTTSLGQLSQADIKLFQKIEKETNPDRINELAFNLVFLSDDKAPLPLLEEAKMFFNLSQKKKNTSLECIAMGMYGQGYRITGDFTKSQEYHFKAIDIAKRISNYSFLGYTLNQSAHMYKDRDENEKAIAIYKEARLAANKGTEPIFKFYPIMNLGFVYMQANQVDSAMYYSTKAVSMIEDLLLHMQDTSQKAIIDRSLLVYCLSNLAGAHSMSNDKINANKYYSEVIKMIEKYKGFKSRYFQFAYFSLAKHYQRYNMEDSAILAAKQAIESVSNGPLEYLSAKPAKMISDFYESKNADSTVKYLKIYLKGNEVMNSTRVTQQLQMRSVEQEEKALETKRAEKAYKDKIAFYLLNAGLAVLLFVAVFMYRSAQQRKRINAELQKQKENVERTLTELKSTQSQLIQSEKMASLGELTAGIAHEIQNPLNFVNNFSEVSNELISELVEEVDKGNTDEVKLIAKDVQQNLEKIHHHGKRADAIVKGMLAHSRTSTGQKEPTDINALCDEYLRLAYHGLKAKDNSFEASFHFEPDTSLPNINVVPQDIGRVLLNLINNAFQAVAEKQKTAGPNYNPEVRVSTKLIFPPAGLPAGAAGLPAGAAGGLRGAKISVMDNGPGIPESIKDKIFQPFFTTKPTGQGTGLGLSLSYDIVKAHGGSLQVNSELGEGACFIINLTEGD
jgi:two-component system, NtrC family, sensor kinase